MKLGVNKIDRLNIEQQYVFVKQLACNETNQNGNLTVGVWSFSLGANYNERNEFCKTSVTAHEYSKYIREKIQEASQFVVNAWSNCMSSSQANIIHYIEPADENETEFDYFIVNKNRALNAKVDNFQHPNAECEDLKNKQIQPGGSPTRSHCKRDPTQPITITTSIDKPGYPLDPVRMPAGYPRISCDPIAIQSRAHPGCITYNFDPNDLYGPLTAAGRNPNVAIRVTNKCAETVTVYGALQGTNGAGIAEKNEIVSPGKEFTIAALGGGGKAYAAVARRCNVSCSNITFMHDGTPITKCSTNPRLP